MSWEWDRVIALIGKDNADKLRGEFPSMQLYVPSKDGGIEVEVKEMLKSTSYRSVADKLGVSLATVYRMSCRPDL